MPDPMTPSVRRLAGRITTNSGGRRILRTLHNVATDLIGAIGPPDLPADCRAWVEDAGQ